MPVYEFPETLKQQLRDNGYIEMEPGMWIHLSEEDIIALREEGIEDVPDFVPTTVADLEDNPTEVRDGPEISKGVCIDPGLRILTPFERTSLA